MGFSGGLGKGREDCPFSFLCPLFSVYFLWSFTVVALCFQIPMVSDYVLRVGWSRLGFCNSGRILPVVKLWFGRSSLAVVGSVWAALTMAGGEASISSSKLRGLGFDGFEGFNLG